VNVKPSPFGVVSWKLKSDVNFATLTGVLKKALRAFRGSAVSEDADGAADRCSTIQRERRCAGKPVVEINARRCDGGYGVSSAGHGARRESAGRAIAFTVAEEVSVNEPTYFVEFAEE